MQHKRMTTCLATAALATALFAFGAPPASAANHTVSVVPGQDLFAPQDLGTIAVGDTITWQNEGTHNVVSAQIPAGATAFTSPTLSGAATFVTPALTIPGNYRYVCTLHSDVAAANATPQSATEMVGQFTVAGGAAAPAPPAPPAPTTAAPAPTTAAPAPTTAAPAPSAAPGTGKTTVKVRGVITGFTPKTITVKARQEVTIALTSPDTDHDLTIADLDFKVIAPEGETVSGTFTAPSKAGRHEFICSVPGHEAAGMVGTLVVQSASGAAPAPKAPAPKAPAATPAQIPAGGVQAGGGSTAGVNNVGLLALGGGLLLAAAISVLLGLRAARRH